MKKSQPKHRAIGIFAKTPVPGRVKTRMTPPLSPEEAAELYSVMLSEVISLFSYDFWDVYLFYTGENVYFNKNYPQYQQIEQRGEDLGIRIDNALKDLLANGHKEVAVIGSDSPDLPISLIENAFDQLQNSQAVLIPTKDGGYAFIGGNVTISPLFRNIQWSTSEVLSETVQRAKDSNIHLSIVDPWSDIDDITDLRTYIKRSPDSLLAQFAIKNYSDYL